EIWVMLLGQHAVGGANLRQRTAAVQAERGVMIFFSALQFPKLLRRRGGGGVVAHRQNLFFRREQMRAFEQTAEIFFAGDLNRALLGREAGHGFIFHLQAFEPHNAEVLLALLPSLALAEFHESSEEKNLSPLI